MDTAIQMPDVTCRVYEKGSKRFPSVWKRELSSLSYQEAWELLKQDPKLHKVMIYRNYPEEFWDLACCNISSLEYGEIFIFIRLPTVAALELMQLFKLSLI